MSGDDNELSSGEVAAAIASSQEKYENPKSVKARARVAEAFEAFKKQRPLSVAIFDAFLHEHGRSRKASTMWTERSLLVRYIRDKYNQDYSDVGTYKNLLAAKSKEEKPTQSSIFEKEELFRFWREAPSDGLMLRHKLVSLVAYYCAGRIGDIVYLDFSDIAFEEAQVAVTIKRSKSAAAAATTRVFIPNTEGLDVVALFKAYMSAQNPQQGRFWRHWRNNRWISQHVGHNPLAETPKEIATWLGKTDVNTFTGHCFRRSSATAYANATGDKLGLKRLGGWRSDTVVERYIAESEHEKKKQAIALGPDDERPQAVAPQPNSAPEKNPHTVMFQNCSNFTVHFH
jgi:integrase